MKENRFVVKGIVHSCENDEHKALIIDESGEMFETAPGTSEQIQKFVSDKSEKYMVPSYFTKACQFDPNLKDLIDVEVGKLDDLRDSSKSL